MKTFLVHEFMSQPVITVSPQVKITEAHQLMKDRRVRRLPVVDQEQLVGILTLLDASEARPPHAETVPPTALHVAISLMKVEDVMTRHPVTISPNATILDAARLMARHKVSGLPVVEHDQLVGLLTESDAFRAIVRAADEEARAIPVTQVSH